MLQVHRISQTGPRAGRTHALSSSSSLLQSSPSSSSPTSPSQPSSSKQRFHQSATRGSSRTVAASAVSSFTSNLLWPAAPRPQDSINSRDVQALERSLNPIPPPPIFVADAATCVLLQAELQAKLESLDSAAGAWDIFSAWGGSEKKDAKAPVFIAMHDGHNVSLAPALFKVSPLTFAMARISYSQQRGSSNVKTAVLAAK